MRGRWTACDTLERTQYYLQSFQAKDTKPKAKSEEASDKLERVLFENESQQKHWEVIPNNINS